MALEDDPSDLDALVRRVDPDRWLSSRFVADPAARADLIAIYAYDYELARAPRTASNPLLGEIRLTWWREVLDEIYEDRPVRRHPTAEALAYAVKRRSLSRRPLEAMIDARYRELAPEPMNLPEALAWAEGTGGGAAEAAAQVLDRSADPATVRSAGAAWAIGRLMATAGLSGADSRTALDAALAGARGVNVAAFPAVAHAALSRPRSKGERVTGLTARIRLLFAVLRGRV